MAHSGARRRSRCPKRSLPPAWVTAGSSGASPPLAGWGYFEAAAAGAAPGLSKFTTGGVEICASFWTVKLGFTA